MFYKGLICLCLAGVPGLLMAENALHASLPPFQFKAANTPDVDRKMPTRILIPDRWSWSGTQETSQETAFHSHDRFRIDIHPRQSGYVYLFCRNSQGEFQLLYPFREDGDNYVTRNTTAPLPGNGWFRFDEEPGQEELFLVQSPSPLGDIEQSIEQGNRLDPVLLEKYDEWTARAVQNDWDEEAPRNVLVKRIFLRHDER